ncbi:7-carboxy-7-deazaguanine synthase QueE [Haloferula rosea]|uniref:7-carboxy-7-deazaguanine synthase n=1 Tax=Haloferula rosea TaxID=490093 RepID=A0A934RC76_9BACT|nr:7-carboxy-7-deazaguanine synthase QueE [Haloferula rosea]MBK1827068.1 7-carboxy-7-deazaguanine synthase QueE [Haloferula rosea]
MKLAKLNDGPEIFHTLQGEGVSAGLPAIFVRASRCNLHCRWCDTDYTWNFEGTPWPHDLDGTPGYRKYVRDEVTLEISPEEIAEELKRYPTRRVVLTGGEPLLQQDDWVRLIDLLRADDPSWTFEVETNGTRLPSPEMEARIDQFNVSPKLSNSGMEESTRIVDEPLTHFAASTKSWFKFVVSKSHEINEIEALATRFQIPAERILLMPEGRTPAELDRHGEEVAALCLDRGWRFCDRLHVRLWGEKRGV